MRNTNEFRRLGSDLPIRIMTAVMCLAFAGVSSGQQNPPMLQIDSPSAGTIVNPGQAITVSVSSPATAAFSAVAVIGQDPLPTSNVQSSIPGQFSITVPTDNS